MFSFLLVAIVGATASATASEPAGGRLSPIVGATAGATASEPAGGRLSPIVGATAGATASEPAGWCELSPSIVPVLEMLGTQALEKICDYLKPVTYKENSFIFRMGDPLDFMLFIIKGTVCTYSWTSSTSATSSKMAAGLLGEGQFYGEDLLNSPDFTQLPISTEHVKTRGKVQAFALMADDLATAVANNCANNNCEEVEDDVVEIKHCAHSADVGGRV
ncbi:hypothetical protein C1H46_009728 [Malus baccata]|uniref:Cyclic nucleotide-binding domain-containing protein n=1 Tax=Malus baccata TaxID=106549 RepID=A0A540N0T3_MALBA|nr:hypothetical protein C1H46_009728 [Malus baccata]